MNENEQENLSGCFDEEYYKWSEEYDRETIKQREVGEENVGS